MHISNVDIDIVHSISSSSNFGNIGNRSNVGNIGNNSNVGDSSNVVLIGWY